MEIANKCQKYIESKWPSNIINPNKIDIYYGNIAYDYMDCGLCRINIDGNTVQLIGYNIEPNVISTKTYLVKYKDIHNDFDSLCNKYNKPKIAVCGDNASFLYTIINTPKELIFDPMKMPDLKTLPLPNNSKIINEFIENKYSGLKSNMITCQDIYKDKTKTCMAILELPGFNPNMISYPSRYFVSIIAIKNNNINLEFIDELYGSYDITEYGLTNLVSKNRNEFYIKTWHCWSKGCGESIYLFWYSNK